MKSKKLNSNLKGFLFPLLDKNKFVGGNVDFFVTKFHANIIISQKYYMVADYNVQLMKFAHAVRRNVKYFDVDENGLDYIYAQDDSDENTSVTYHDDTEKIKEPWELKEGVELSKWSSVKNIFIVEK